jgi:hypothetical protein
VVAPLELVLAPLELAPPELEPVPPGVVVVPLELVPAPLELVPPELVLVPPEPVPVPLELVLVPPELVVVLAELDPAALVPPLDPALTPPVLAPELPLSVAPVFEEPPGEVSLVPPEQPIPTAAQVIKAPAARAAGRDMEANDCDTPLRALSIKVDMGGLYYVHAAGHA